MKRLGWMGFCLILALASGSAQASPASPQLDVATREQFYVLSFTDMPISDVAHAVVEAAMAESITIDPAVDGAVNFKVEGWFTQDALLREFGTTLVDQDATLVRNSDGSLAVVARDNLPFAVARGASLVALPEVAPGPAVATATPPRPPIVYGEDRWWDGEWGQVALFLGGLGTGAAAVLGALAALRTRRLRSVARWTPLLLERSFDEPVRDDPPIDGDELVIPAFETASTDRAMSPPS